MNQTYLLSDPRTGEVRYVGVSKNPHNRFKSHYAERCDISEGNMSGWIYNLDAQGLKPFLIIIADCDVEREAFFSLKRSGARLYNKSTPPVNRRA